MDENLPVADDIYVAPDNTAEHDEADGDGV